MNGWKFTIAALALAVLAACGGGKGASSGSATTAATAGGAIANSAAAPMGGVSSSGNAMAPGTFATIPPTLQCGAVQPVWVNTTTHVYHLAKDPLYGRSKHGTYMCPSAAKAQGDKPAGAKARIR